MISNSSSRPRIEPVVARSGKSSSAGKKNAKPDSPPRQPPVTIDDLVAADFLGYTSAWEFVAERFHCDEAFLRHINPQLKGHACRRHRVPGA